MYVQLNIKGKKINFIKARIHCEIYLSDCFMKHNLMHISLHLIWFHEIRITYVKRKPPRTFISKKCHIPMFATSPCCGNWLTCFPWKGYFHRRLFFLHIILTEIKTGAFTIEFRWFWAIKNFRTGALCRIFKYSTDISKYQATYR